mmetsp:Transcript_82470/g.209679  ORF Transcript_82470/g.209679 Transcript_82470/m.209679 type:complete len:171 (-) Transcript_82470:299-811(-)|eukprot:CAMPEP_0183582120 /NCGR_PEP_ID=MMETSP0371-20130417/149076_1 /TAXON_ID=268820 /ORGANISM="Peridinium aciculiferum, Strain PAER-2" /LENGTH=170 /DNA_ID=CAMNT_0025792843 /DNA_START=75 /DNA_END=587 /DNA_ORIENTATION=-
MQLPALKAQGITLHAVTAESGGDAEIVRRLQERHTTLDFPVHSDPEHRLLVSSTEPFYIKVEHAASKYKGTYTDYTMVQPALVVVGKTGVFQQAWSWMTGALRGVEPKTEFTRVPSQGGLILAGVRPISEDLASSVKEGRDVKLSGKPLFEILKEKMVDIFPCCMARQAA